MVELLKLLMREVKNMPKADNRTLGDNIINRTLNCIYQLQLAYDSHDNTTIRLQALKAFDTEFSTLCTYLRVVNELRLLSLKVMVNIFERTETIAKYGVTEAMAVDMCKDAGLYSPMYDIAPRGGCWFCPNVRIKTLVEFRRKHPELWAELLELGKTPNLCSYGFKYGKTVEEIDRRLDFEERQLKLF